MVYMKIVKFLTVAAVLGFSVNAMAACNYECKRNKVLSDNEIAAKTKIELKNFYDKNEKIYRECQKKRKDLKATLSSDAKKALAKHRKKRDFKKKKTDKK